MCVCGGGGGGGGGGGRERQMRSERGIPAIIGLNHIMSLRIGSPLLPGTTGSERGRED